MKEQPTTETAGQKPAAKLQIGLLYADIWANTIEGKTFYNTDVYRRYQDEAGNWQSTRRYSFGELLTASKLHDMAHTKILELRAHASQAGAISVEDAI